MSTPIAVVQFGDDPMPGVLYTADGDLFVVWQDDHADMVFRDRRGWYWDEYGDADAPTGTVKHPHTQWGTRLRIVSRKKSDIASVAAHFRGEP